jgi:sarcosine oxidase subunit alpha
LETTVSGIYVAGDICGVEEATAAMLEGKIAGINAAQSLGYQSSTTNQKREEAQKELEKLRQGPSGEKIRNGLNKIFQKRREEILC